MVKQLFHVMATFIAIKTLNTIFPIIPITFRYSYRILYVSNSIFHFPISTIYALAYALAGVETTKQFDSVCRQKLPAP